MELEATGGKKQKTFKTNALALPAVDGSLLLS